MNPNDRRHRLKLKDEGFGGKLIAVSIVIILISAGTVRVALSAFSIVGMMVGIVLFIIGFIIMPGKPKDRGDVIDEQRGYVRRDCVYCGLELKFEPVTQTFAPCECSLKRRCPQCDTELIYDDIEQIYNCPYCHVGFN
jgi:hypothetical protein